MGKAARVTREQEAAIEQLTDSKAPKRVSAANKLGRKPCPNDAGPKLLEAFKAELDGTRSWKVLAAQAKALARNPHPPAHDFLLGIAGDDLGGSAVNEAVGFGAMGCGRDDPDATLRALLGDEADVPTDRLAAIIGALTILGEDPPELDAALVERLVELAEEEPPNTVPHGAHRRRRVNDLRCELQNAAPQQRDRVAQLGELSL
jgi:hypothetical protein